MAEGERLICPSSDLVEAGTGVRFSVMYQGREVPAFVVRYRGHPRAYINECGHVPAELDWQPGEFFDYSKLYLICSIHGALYSPDDGRCLGGRCQGKGLKPLAVVERDDAIYFIADNNHG